MRDGVSAILFLPVIGCVEPTQNNVAGETGTSANETGGGATSMTGTGTTGSTNSTMATTSASGADTTADSDDSGESSNESGGPVCGNGMIEFGEVCDDGINDGSYDGCSEDCTQLGPHCGDGAVQRDEGEACDDGDGINGNGCNVDCIESGTVLWTESYPNAGEDFAMDVDVDENGTSLVVGYAEDGDGDQTNSLLLWYDTDGPFLDALTPTEWYAGVEFGGPGYVLREFDTGDGAAVVGFDEANTLAWRRVMDPTPGPLIFYLQSIAIDPEGNVYVGGMDSPEPLQYHSLRAKLDADGEILWSESSVHDVANCSDVAILEAGALFLCSSLVRWVDADGSILDEVTQNLFEIATASDGSYAGASSSGVYGFDADGVELWNAPTGPSEDIAIDGDGNVVAIGDGVIVKYDSNGAELWSRTVDATVRAVAIAPGDAIVVVGDIDGGATAQDVWLRKYAP